MTENLPDYSAIELPDETPRSEYSTHERRAEVWRAIQAAGSPARVNKAGLARRYDVSRDTIYRDFDRLREWAGDTLGDDAKLTTRAVFEKAIDELLAADDWRATAAAFDKVMEWNEWLADLGEQHREPQQSELDVDIDSRHSEMAYTIVREGDDEPLPTTDDPDGGERVDYEELGFTASPSGSATEIDVEHPRSDRDE